MVKKDMQKCLLQALIALTDFGCSAVQLVQVVE